MASIMTAVVTDYTRSSGARAVRTENDDGIYIPTAQAESLSLRPFDLIECVVVANDHPTLPWRAICTRLQEDAK